MLVCAKFRFFGRSFNLIARVLLLKPFIVFLNFRCHTESVMQYNGNKISSVPLFVTNFLNDDVSFINTSMADKVLEKARIP